MNIIKQINSAIVEHQFLQAEWYKNAFNKYRTEFNHLITNPDLENESENKKRRELLWSYREGLLLELPSDIQWSLASLEEADFSKLLIFRYIGWEKTFGNNKSIGNVASVVVNGVVDQGMDLQLVHNIERSIESHDFSEKIICIGTTLLPPFTILDGNHRAVAFELHKIKTGKTSHLPKEIIVGTSPSMDQCCWMNSVEDPKE